MNYRWIGRWMKGYDIWWTASIYWYLFYMTGELQKVYMIQSFFTVSSDSYSNNIVWNKVFVSFQSVTSKGSFIEVLYSHTHMTNLWISELLLLLFHWMGLGLWPLFSAKGHMFLLLFHLLYGCIFDLLFNKYILVMIVFFSPLLYR